jgi:bifunctional non-homologous end joining protein LigD
MKLKEYNEKREFKKTPEPKPGLIQKGEGKYLIFVVHKHAARNLHYDLRLEMKGVLKSFAIPKGPSLDVSLKRLAVMVEDHPFEYKDFEGIIPEGSYGAGSVILWDRGFYSSLSSSDKDESEEMLLNGLKKGELKFILSGEKLKGEFLLVRTRLDKNSWLLIKKKDMYASAKDILKNDRSVLSNKTIEEIEGAPETLSVKNAESVVVNSRKAADMKDAPRGKIPHNVRPMLAVSAERPFNDDEWFFEIKWDGYRAIAEIGEKNALLYSRNLISLAEKFPGIVETLKKFKFNAVLDGEIVNVNKAGKPDFQQLQDFREGSIHKRFNGSSIIYYVFDVLYYNGCDLTGLELVKRKELLEKIFSNDGNVRVSGHVKGEGIAFFNAAKKNGLEGIVAKYSKSRYSEGVRSKHWLKIKLHNTQDCVIAGFTEPQKSRKFLGSLVLGAYEKNKLVYIGHSGGGFHGENIRTIYEKLQPLIQEECPFKIKPPESGTVTWVKPILVCEVAFMGWTKDGIMRQPNFLRFRDDKLPAEAILERTGKE